MGSPVNKVFLKFYIYSTNLWWVLSSLVTFYWITGGPAVSSLHLVNWMQLDLLCASWDFRVDSLSGIMLLVIGVTSGIVSSYSLDYMYGDAHQNQFVALLCIFAFAINGLVVSNNLVVVFFSWELVGLCSYLLICFSKRRQHSLKSSLKAVLWNKVGDVSVLLAVGCAFELLEALDFVSIVLLLP
jgi:NADH-quinone oxidoreductase subunit L